MMTGNRFYRTMGLVLLALVILGFGLTAVVRGQNPFEMPLLFHLHGVAYLMWYGLFIYQVSLIGKGNRSKHMKLGQLSLVLVATMLITAWMMARGSYARGISPIPNISIQQFAAFPFFDLVGLLVFYGLAFAKRFDADFHKRAMLLCLIAILDPAIARLGMAIGFPPFPLVASVLLVGAIIWHDRKVLNRVHMITWFGFVWIFLRLGFVFGFAAGEQWAGIAHALFS